MKLLKVLYNYICSKINVNYNTYYKTNINIFNLFDQIIINKYIF